MAKSVFDLLTERFGVRTRANENPEVTEVGVADIVVLRADPNRLAFVAFNLSANTIFLKPGVGVSAAAGIALTAGTGSLSVAFEEDFALPALEWHALAAGANSAIYILEILSGPT